MKPRLLETRHLEISVHINIEENIARRGLQATVQRSSQKLEEDKKWLMTWQKWEASIGVS